MFCFVFVGVSVFLNTLLKFINFFYLFIYLFVCFALYDRVNGFNLWFEESKESLSEGNPELSGTDLVKFAMRQWKALDEDEKMEWNRKAKEAAGEMEQGDKKRKRENCDDENEDTLNTLNSAKKTKDSVANGATSKLAGFIYNKN